MEHDFRAEGGARLAGGWNRLEPEDNKAMHAETASPAAEMTSAAAGAETASPATAAESTSPRFLLKAVEHLSAIFADTLAASSAASPEDKFKPVPGC